MIAVITIAFSALTAYAQDKSILKLADEYAAALKNYQAQKSRLSIEGVISRGTAVSGRLDEIESLSDADYALLEKKMKGYLVNRQEILFIEPDLKFFINLSKTRGTKADIAFFDLMRQIRPDSVWAAYTEQQTDVTGCTRYGSGLLTGLYGKALQFKQNYPKSYTGDINEEIEGILSPFLEGTCACGNRAGVLKEFRLFIKTYPKDKNTRAIKKRLENLEKDKDFRFNCQSG